mmetsp:Transcript_29907/g.94311  ORF Transcript_29907/g.94311 Transcript_29907/m.94311 type:complete len:212 (+) Transcript_29907:206-841(+)
MCRTSHPAESRQESMRAGAKSTVRLQPGGGAGLGGAAPTPTRRTPEASWLAGVASAGGRVGVGRGSAFAREPKDEDRRAEASGGRPISESAFSIAAASSPSSPFPFFLLCLPFDLLALPSMNFASSSMLFSSGALASGDAPDPLPELPAAPLSSTRQMTHSKGTSVRVSSALQSKEFALHTRRSTSMHIHQRLRTSFWPLWQGSSMMSVTI